MLEQHDVELGIFERQVERVRNLERYGAFLAGPAIEIARGLDERLAKIDARYSAAIGLGENPRRPADPGADIENGRRGCDPGEFCKLERCGVPARVKLINPGKLLGRKELLLLSEHG